MRFLKRVVMAAVLAAGLSAAVAAQPPGGFGGGFGFGFGGGVYNLVATNKALQEELKVTDEQKEKLAEALKPITEKRREMFQGFQPGQPPSAEQVKEMRDKGEKLNAETRKAVEAVLKPEQAKRLSQIGYQQMGVNAFTNKDVEAGLKLTDGQKEKIKGVVEELNKDRMEIFRSGPRIQFGQPPSEEDQKKLAENRKKTEALAKDAEEKIEGLLKDDQKAAWKELTGAKFDVSKLQQGFGQRRRDN
jgi:Spy/CpxP family protein refolding chaperone